MVRDVQPKRVFGMKGLTRQKGWVFGAMLAFLAPGAWAQSVTVEVGGRAISLVAPEGHCFLDKTIEADKRLLSITERGFSGINRLLVQFADCGELNLWRNGRQPTLNNFGYAFVSIKAEHKMVNISRQAFLTRLATYLAAKEGRDSLEKGLSIGVKRLERMRNAGDHNIRMGERKVLGLMFRDENALCVGIVLGLTTEFGKQKTALGCGIVTVLRNRVVNLQIFRPNDARSVELLMSSARELAAMNVAINER